MVQVYYILHKKKDIYGCPHSGKNKTTLFNCCSLDLSSVCVYQITFYGQLMQKNTKFQKGILTFATVFSLAWKQSQDQPVFTFGHIQLIFQVE